MDGFAGVQKKVGGKRSESLTNKIDNRLQNEKPLYPAFFDAFLTLLVKKP